MVAAQTTVVQTKESTLEERQIVKYWLAQVKRAQKAIPQQEWDMALARLSVDSYTAPDGTKLSDETYVNGFRQHYEALKSFLDRNEAEFRVLPTEAFVSDPVAKKQAECDAAYLKYVWAEQRCQAEESNKLDSCLIRNVGCTAVGFDKRKWMPTCNYFAARKLLRDPDCEGNDRNAKWEGYWEDISLEELKAKHAELSDEEIEKIKKGSVLDEEKQKEVAEDADIDVKMFSTIRVFHIFARGDAAIRIADGSKEKIPSESIAQQLALTTPKRYLQVVDGCEKPLVDDDNWPYELDDDEFPTTILMFNRPTEKPWGFTDERQMRRLDTMFDNVCADIEQAAYWEARKKFAGKSEGVTPSDANIEDFLNNPKKSYLPGFMGSDGKPLIEQINTGRFPDVLPQVLKMTDEFRRDASSLGELMHTEIAEFKDVTALSAQMHFETIHQKVNRRLNGPQGYEQSIADDARKMLEVAHQFVPMYSLVETPKAKVDIDEFGTLHETGETYMDVVELPWEQALKALMHPQASLIALGVDAIVGPELAEFWRTSDAYPPRLFKLSTTVSVVPGSTRSVTKEQRAAMLKQYFLEVFMPLYQATKRWDLAVKFIGRLCPLIDLTETKELLPDAQEVQQQMMLAQQAAAIEEAGPAPQEAENATV